jgi:CheY-like chemotaxis protein
MGPEKSYVVVILSPKVGFARVREAALKGKGYRVLRAAKGQDGINLALKHAPCLLIMDSSVTQPSADEVVKAIRSHPSGSKVKIEQDGKKRLPRIPFRWEMPGR